MYLKQYYIYIFCILALAGCGPEKEVRITGQLSGSNAEKIFLHELGNDSKLKGDTAQLDARGNFAFRRKIVQPAFYTLTVNDKSVYLVVHPGERIAISGDARELPLTYSVSGSEDSKKIHMLGQRLEHTVLIRDSLIQTLKIYEGNRNFVNIQRQFDWTYNNELDSLRAFNIRFMEKNPLSLAVIYALYQKKKKNKNIFLFNQEDDIRYFRRADSSFYRRYPKMGYVNMLHANVLDMNERYNSVQWNRMLSMLGQEAPEIALPAPGGKVMKLSDNRGKFVLVDFWASWSAPCRTENINLLDIYKKYRDKGFEIYQISLDQSKASWERAIKEDGLTWVNVSDLKYWDSEIVTLYGVETIPANFLVDRAGNIMTKNITGDVLEKKLNELFLSE
jgi:peroxiredoxin